MNKKMLTSNLEDNLNMIYSSITVNFNFIKRELLLKGDLKCTLLYIDGLSQQSYIEASIIKPLLSQLDCDMTKVANPIDYLVKKCITLSDLETSNDVDKLLLYLKRGKCIVLIENEDMAILCNTTGGEKRAVGESTCEKSLKGGKEAFVENLMTNITLVQNKLRNDNLKIVHYLLGEKNQVDAVLLYIDNIIDPKVLNEIKNRISTIKAPHIPDTGYINQLIESFPYSFFPQCKSTEKPDKVISDIIQGKAAMIIDGSPIALIMPAVFIEFFQGFEDYSQRIVLVNFDRIIRLLATILILTLSSVYLVLLMYNSELIPIALQKVIYDTRIGIPLPPFFEILIMELIVDFLREGGLRLPTPIGQTLSIVGGIVLGDSATKAGLVSPTTLVVVSITVISTFLIPNYEMALSIRVLRYFMLVMTAFFALFGLIIGLYVILLKLIKMDSFGVPYFTPFAPLRFKDLKDSIIRAPIKYFSKPAVSFKVSKRKSEK